MTPKVASIYNKAFSRNPMFPMVTPSCMKLHKAQKRIPKPCVGCSNHLGSARRLAYSLRICRAFFIMKTRKRLTGGDRSPPYAPPEAVNSYKKNTCLKLAYCADEMGFGEEYLPHQSCIVNKPFVKIHAMQRTTASGVTGSHICVGVPAKQSFVG